MTADTPAGCPPPWQAAHDAAVAVGARTYVDPPTGYLVQTEQALRERGECCDLGCRHCPYRDVGSAST